MTIVLDASEQYARQKILDFYQSALHESGKMMIASAAPMIVAQGDSWTDYPPGNDLIQSLRNSGFSIRNFGTAGDTLENMLYGSKYRERRWSRLPSEHPEVIEIVKQYSPRFFLFSGCGNDIAGDEFASYLNHKDSQEYHDHGGVRVEYTHYMMNTVFKNGYIKMIDSVLTASQGIHILIHGYAYTVPTGLGVFNLPGSHFIGPWLKPALVSKGITDPNEQYRIVKQQIDAFNTMLASLAGAYPGKVHHIDLRPHIRPLDWVNELHLNKPGFDKAAGYFIAEMNKVMSDSEKAALEENRKAVAAFLNDVNGDQEMMNMLAAP